MTAALEHTDPFTGLFGTRRHGRASNVALPERVTNDRDFERVLAALHDGEVHLHLQPRYRNELVDYLGTSYRASGELHCASKLLAAATENIEVSRFLDRLLAERVDHLCAQTSGSLGAARAAREAITGQVAAVITRRVIGHGRLPALLGLMDFGRLVARASEKSPVRWRELQGDPAADYDDELASRQSWEAVIAAAIGVANPAKTQQVLYHAVGGLIESRNP